MRLILATTLFCTLSVSQSFAQTADSDCPGPIFNTKPTIMVNGGKLAADCVHPGAPKTGGSPKAPPGPILREVDVLYQSLDFNSYYGVVDKGDITIMKGAPEVSSDLANTLELSGEKINPNATYMVPNKFIVDPQIGDHAIVIGGGALTQ